MYYLLPCELSFLNLSLASNNRKDCEQELQVVTLTIQQSVSSHELCNRQSHLVSARITVVVPGSLRLRSKIAQC